MFGNRRLDNLIICSVAYLLGGCSGSLPVVDLEFTDPATFRGYVEAIVRHVGCELGQSVQVEYSPSYSETYDLRKWAAKIALTIRAKNTLAANGATTLANAASSGVFSLGIGSQSDSTREMVITYFVPFDELLKRKFPLEPDGIHFVPCDRADLPSRGANDLNDAYLRRPIAGDLGIDTTLKSAMETWTSGLLSSRVEKGPFETVTHHVTFEVKLNANANPSLKFVNVSANAGGKLLDATRIDTNELQITMGPLVTGTRKIEPSKALNDEFFIERLKTSIRRDF